MKIARLFLASAVLLCVSCIPTYQSDKPPTWGTGGGTVGSNATGAVPGVLVIGDSLVEFASPQTLADMIRFWRGLSAVVAAAGGASVAHFNSPTLVPGNLATIANAVAFFQPRITVLALGSNDARIITYEIPDQYGYRIGEWQQQAALATNNALAHSQCVVWINVADHWAPTASSQVVGQINAGLAALDVANSRVFTFDWNAFSAGHEDWFFAPGNIHHSAVGMGVYRDFINNAIASAMASGC